MVARKSGTKMLNRDHSPWLWGRQTPDPAWYGVISEGAIIMHNPCEWRLARVRKGPVLTERMGTHEANKASLVVDFERHFS